MKALVLLLLSSASLLAHSAAQQCGELAGGGLCPNGLCCSQWGWCGTTSSYCSDGCQSQCWGPLPPPPPPTPSSSLPPPRLDGVIQVINSSIFDEFLPYRNDPRCPAADFYTFEAFVAAADTFPDFATTGDMEIRKREIAAFFGQTSQETTGGWPDAPGGQFAWGYCFKADVNPQSDYCIRSIEWPCVPGKTYYGRGPMQLTYNYNYGRAGEALGLDLLSNPDLVAQDPVVAFRTAIWFWMTPQPPKPSCHDVIVGQWQPTIADTAAGRLPGYGVIINIINGGMECGHGPNNRVMGRIMFYERYCDIYEISYEDNLDCYNQTPFDWDNLVAKRGPNESKASF